jgi:putative phage-type endonuclease
VREIAFKGEDHQKSWLNWRRQGICASEISSVLGRSPYKSRGDLLKEKATPLKESKPNPQMLHGLVFEPIARKLFNSKYKLSTRPIYVEDSKNQQFRASLDGFDKKSKTLIEIKCPASQRKITHLLEGGDFPLVWELQLQWQMMITTPWHAFFVVLDYSTGAISRFRREGDKEIQEKMAKEALFFLDELQAKIKK